MAIQKRSISMSSLVNTAISNYEIMLLNNLPRISSIESSLRSLTWLLPGRFQDSELASEALYSLLNVLSLYHDSVLLRSLSSLPPAARPSLSSHTRYTRHFTSTSPSYALLARTLTLLSYSELLIEMGIQKRLGAAKADQVVLSIEGMKAVLRLALMKITGGRTGVQPAVPEREIDPSSVLEKYSAPVVIEGDPPNVVVGFLPNSTADVVARLQETKSHPDYWKGTRTGYSHPTLASIRPTASPLVGDATASVLGGKESIHTFLASKVLTVEDAKRPEELILKAKGLAQFAEIIWILRPVIYAFAIKKYGKRHSFPFALSLLLEYLAYTLRTRAASNPTKSSGPMLPNLLSQAETLETTKRAKAFWRYFLRGPVWEGWTKPQIEGFANLFEGKPVIGFVSMLAKDYLPLIDSYHFYTN